MSQRLTGIIRAHLCNDNQSGECKMSKAGTRRELISYLVVFALVALSPICFVIYWHYCRPAIVRTDATTESVKDDSSQPSRGSQLFDQGRDKEAKEAFESDLAGTMRDPEDATDYALTLHVLDKDPEAIKVCHGIMRRYPHSKTAQFARSCILAWTGKSALKSDGDLGILGFTFSVAYPQPAKVQRIYPDTPAKRSQLQVQDLIVAVDGVPTSQLTTHEVAEMLAGQPDTKVNLTIKRGHTTLEKALTRMHSKEFACLHPNIWKTYLAPF